jgi:hypothetical protein
MATKLSLEQNHVSLLPIDPKSESLVVGLSWDFFDKPVDLDTSCVMFGGKSLFIYGDQTFVVT